MVSSHPPKPEGTCCIPIVSAINHNSDLPILAGFVGGAPARILFDSGASVNLVSESFISKLNLPHSAFSSCNLNVCGVTTNNLNVTKSVNISISMGNKQFPSNFYIVTTLPNQYEVLVGSSFLKEYKFSINFSKNLISAPGLRMQYCDLTEKLNPSAFNVVPSEPVFAYVHRKTILPPHSENLVTIRMKNLSFPRDTQVIIQAVDKSKHEFFLANSVNTTNTDGTYLVKVANFTDKKVHLNKKQKLAVVEPLQVNSAVVNLVKEDADLPDDQFEVWGGEFQLEHLESSTKQELLKLIGKYKNIFAKSVRELEGCSTLYHRIHLSDDVPVRQKAYRTPHHLKNELQTQIYELLDAGIIRESTSPYAAPILLVKKQDGTYRLVTDFRKLNSKTQHDPYPIPNINEMIEDLNNAQYFTSLDLTSGFFQMAIHSEDTYKTAFTCDYGHFEWRRVPFGLKNSPNSFQRLMEVVLSGLKPLNIAIYIDDIIVSSQTIPEHLEKLEILFKRLKEHGLKLKPSKCKFLQKTIKYLGFKIGDGKVVPDEQNLQTIGKFQIPSNKKQVRAFLGLTGFYRRFIQNYAEKALPLTELTKQDIKFTWNEKAQQAFQILKDDLLKIPSLNLPDFSKEFVLSTDASGSSLGAVLAQNNEEGFPQPVAYASKKLKDQERRYSTIERECLAIIWAISHFKHYLVGRHFTIFCDQAALSHIFRLKDPTSRIARWLMIMQQYNFDIVHKPGKLNHTADFLSRYVNTVQSQNEHTLLLGNNSRERISLHQKSDPFCQQIVGKIKANEPISPKALVFFIKDDLLFCLPKKPTRRNDSIEKLVIPRTLIEEVLQLCHDSSIANHAGFHTTLTRVKKNYFWPNFYKHIRNFIQSCQSCVKQRGFRKTARAPLQRIPIANRPFEKIAMDAMGPLPRTPSNNTHIIVISDYFTRWPEAYPVPDLTTETVIKVLQQFIATHGIPEHLITDRGTSFISEAIQRVYKSLGITKHTTTALHPQSDGVVERFNSKLIKTLTHLVREQYNLWDEFLPFALLTHRTSIHSSIGDTPAFVLFGRDLRIPEDLINKPPDRSYIDTRDYCTELIYKLQAAHKVVKQNLTNAAQKQETYRAKTAVDKKIQVGDLVFLHYGSSKLPKKHKFDTGLQGPFRVCEKVTPVNFKIHPLNEPSKTQTVHVDRLIKLHERMQYSTLPNDNQEQQSMQRIKELRSCSRQSLTDRLPSQNIDSNITKNMDHSHMPRIRPMMTKTRVIKPTPAYDLRPRNAAGLVI